MSEKDFDKGYKSGFKFGEEITDDKWVVKINETTEEIQSQSYVIGYDPNKRLVVNTNDVINMLTDLIESVRNVNDEQS